MLSLIHLLLLLSDVSPDAFYYSNHLKKTFTVCNLLPSICETSLPEKAWMKCAQLSLVVFSTFTADSGENVESTAKAWSRWCLESLQPPSNYFEKDVCHCCSQVCFYTHTHNHQERMSQIMISPVQPQQHQKWASINEILSTDVWKRLIVKLISWYTGSR